MTTDSLIIDTVGDVVVIRLNDEKSLNAVSWEMVEGVMDTFKQAAETKKRAIVLTGAGRAFCSGANLGVLPYSDDDSYDAGGPLETHYNPLMKAIRDLPMPLVTAVNGLAAGVGSTLALAGDLIIASEKAYFLQAFWRVGVAPDAGTAYLLTRAAGRVRAMEMMMLGEKIPAEKALEWGLINRVVAPEDVESTALNLAQQLASGPTKAYAAIRKQCWSALEQGFEDQLTMDRVVQRELGRTVDHREALAAFFEKRPVTFIGE